MASAEFEISIAGGGYADSPQDGSGGDAVILRLKSVTGVSGGIRWRCIGTHDSSVTIASIQALMDAGLGGTPSGQTCSFTLPAGTGQGYLIECTVNGGIDANGVAQSALVQNGIVGVLNSLGVAPVVLNETFERDATHGVVGRINTALNTAAGGALSAPADSADNGKVAIASGGDLSYSLLANANVDAAAAIAVTKLAYGTANYIVKTNGGGTALEHGLIANANIDAAAAIAITKLAAGTANYVAKTNTGGTAAEYGLLANANVDAAAAIDGTKISPDFGTQSVVTTGNLGAADGIFTGDVTANSFDTSSGGAPTGGAIGIENAGAIRWGGFSSGSADLTLDSSDRLVYESVDGDQFQLAPSRDGSIALYRNGVDAGLDTTDATPTEICRLALPPNYQGVIDFVALGHKDGSEATDNLYVHSQVGVLTDGSTVTLTAASAEAPVPIGDASTDSWAVTPGSSGLNVTVSVTGGAYNVSWSASLSTRPMRAN